MMDINKLIDAEGLAGREVNEHMLELEPWSENEARRLARSEGIELTDAHMAVLVWLRDHFIECGPAESGHALTRALDEAFTKEGGGKYLYRLFPQGPVTQGCRLARLPVPPGSVDKSFGSTH